MYNVYLFILFIKHVKFPIKITNKENYSLSEKASNEEEDKSAPNFVHDYMIQHSGIIIWIMKYL